jgi:hypothetical protein
MEFFRSFLCTRCRKEAQVCSTCDRGQRYCSKDCSAIARRESQRAAGRRYQSTQQGRVNHRIRQQKYLSRIAQMTHHTSLDTRQVVDIAKTTDPCTAPVAIVTDSRMQRCICCEKQGNGLTRRGYLRQRRTRPKSSRRNQGSPDLMGRRRLETNLGRRQHRLSLSI